MSQEALANKNTLSPINIKWAIVIILSSLAGMLTYLLGLDSKMILFVSITTIALTIWAMELLFDATSVRLTP